MHLNDRQRDRQQRIHQRHAGVGVPPRVNDNAVRLLKIRAVHLINERALVVGLEYLYFQPQLLCALAQIILQVGIAFLPVNSRLPDAQHIQVGPVDDKQLHTFPPFGKFLWKAGPASRPVLPLCRVPVTARRAGGSAAVGAACGRPPKPSRGRLALRASPPHRLSSIANPAPAPRPPPQPLAGRYSPH